MKKDAQENKQADVIACCVIMMSLSASAVALRLLVRRTSAAGLWYDDYAIMAALFFSYGLEVPVFVGKEMIAHTISCSR